MGGDKLAEQMTYEQALEIANKALLRYKQSETKGEVEEIFIKYGRDGVGYRPLCRMFFSHMSPEKALKAYKKE
jgi:peptide methionine sulfoxide reductase MsrA